MALTTEQEEILEKMIEAFENGKRLSDLPDVGDTSPFELYTEVLDSDGESKKARLASLLPYVEDDVSYGIRRDISDSSPSCTRIGNADLHRTLPVQSLMRGCLLDDGGGVVEYLPSGSWEGATLDGSRGQVMVEIPAHWRKTAAYDDGTMEVRLSLSPLSGYLYVPRMYISAYEATVQRSTSKLCSVKNTDADYRGGNNNADYDGTGVTFLGRPATGISSVNFLNYARNRGAAGKDGCGWNSCLYEAQKALYWLFVVEYATLNSQADYNAQTTEEGYHQGGLGAGVTTLNSTYWSNMNGLYPFVPCGHTDSLGNGTGCVGYEMPEEYGAALTVQVPRYRGVENPFGHIYKWLCDILVCAHPSEENGGTGKNSFYVCKEPSKFSGTSYGDYTFIGDDEGSASGGAWLYPTRVILGEEGEFIGSDSGGSTSTFYCDGNYANNSNTSDSLRGVRFGGTSADAASAGLVCVSSSHAPSYSDAYCGSRLCFIPA